MTIIDATVRLIPEVIERSASHTVDDIFVWTRISSVHLGPMTIGGWSFLKSL